MGSWCSTLLQSVDQQRTDRAGSPQGQVNIPTAHVSVVRVLHSDTTKMPPQNPDAPSLLSLTTELLSLVLSCQDFCYNNSKATLNATCKTFFNLVPEVLHNQSSNTDIKWYFTPRLHRIFAPGNALTEAERQAQLQQLGQRFHKCQNLNILVHGVEGEFDAAFALVQHALPLIPHICRLQLGGPLAYTKGYTDANRARWLELRAALSRQLPHVHELTADIADDDRRDNELTAFLSFAQSSFPELEQLRVRVHFLGHDSAHLCVGRNVRQLSVRVRHPCPGFRIVSLHGQQQNADAPSSSTTPPPAPDNLDKLEELELKIPLECGAFQLHQLPHMASLKRLSVCLPVPWRSSDVDATDSLHWVSQQSALQYLDVNGRVTAAEILMQAGGFLELRELRGVRKSEQDEEVVLLERLRQAFPSLQTVRFAEEGELSFVNPWDT